MSKFQIGDKVKVVNGGWGIADSDVENLRGEVFEVFSYLSDGYFGEEGYLLKPSLLKLFKYVPGEDGFIGKESLKLVEAAQESNETASLVHKTTPKNDDSSERDSQPRVDKNAWFERGELPPIGSKVLFYSDDFENEDYWNKDLTNQSEVEIIAHIASSVRQNEADLAVFVFQLPDGNCPVEQAVSCCFRPIITVEELEAELLAEARKKAVAKMLEIVKANSALFDAERVKMQALYDAGLRFTKEE